MLIKGIHLYVFCQKYREAKMRRSGSGLFEIFFTKKEGTLPQGSRIVQVGGKNTKLTRLWLLSWADRCRQVRGDPQELPTCHRRARGARVHCWAVVLPMRRTRAIVHTLSPTNGPSLDIIRLKQFVLPFSFPRIFLFRTLPVSLVQHLSGY